MLYTKLFILIFMIDDPYFHIIYNLSLEVFHGGFYFIKGRREWLNSNIRTFSFFFEKVEWLNDHNRLEPILYTFIKALNANLLSLKLWVLVKPRHESFWSLLIRGLFLCNIRCEPGLQQRENGLTIKKRSFRQIMFFI